jgi:hypothetical protein
MQDVQTCELHLLTSLVEGFPIDLHSTSTMSLFHDLDDDEEVDIFSYFGGRIERPRFQLSSTLPWDDDFDNSRLLAPRPSLIDPFDFFSGSQIRSRGRDRIRAIHRGVSSSQSPNNCFWDWHGSGIQDIPRESDDESSQSPKKRKRHVVNIPIQSSENARKENRQQKKDTILADEEDQSPSCESANTTDLVSLSTIQRKSFDASRIRNKDVRQDVLAYFGSLWDVPPDGNCGYYVLFGFLQDNGLLPSGCKTVTDLRRYIYNYAVQHKQRLLAKDSYFVKLGYWKVSHDHDGLLAKRAFEQDISKIYNDYTIFEGGCRQEYWMNANIVMPLVALCFGINIWLLSADGDPFYDHGSGKTLSDKPYTTMYTLNKEGTVTREVVEGIVAFPVEAPGDDSDGIARKTAHVIHIEGNHYIGAKR